MSIMETLGFRKASGVGEAGWGRTLFVAAVSLVYFLPVLFIIFTAIKPASVALSVPRPPEDTAWFMATGTVRVSELESSSANRNSFQVRMRPKTKVAASPATTWGRQILKNTRVSDEPSMRAASSISSRSACR